MTSSSKSSGRNFEGVRLRVWGFGWVSEYGGDKVAATCVFRSPTSACYSWCWWLRFVHSFIILVSCCDCDACWGEIHELASQYIAVIHICLYKCLKIEVSQNSCLSLGTHLSTFQWLITWHMAWNNCTLLGNNFLEFSMHGTCLSHSENIWI